MLVYCRYYRKDRSTSRLQSISDDDDIWHSAIRFGFGKANTKEEIEYTTDQVI